MPVLTNSELAAIITRNHQEVTEWLGRVENQVKQTNGRVKELERKEIARDAIADYKTRRENDKRWDTTTVLSLVLVIATVASAIAFWVAKK